MTLEIVGIQGKRTSSFSWEIRVVVSIDLVKKALDELFELRRHLELAVLFHFLK
jgi:hypothetical protein